MAYGLGESESASRRFPAHLSPNRHNDAQHKRCPVGRHSASHVISLGEYLILISARRNPVSKPRKDHHDPESYRQIPLLSVVNKVLEAPSSRINRLNKHRLVNEDHFRLKSGHSTTSLLFRIIDDTTTTFNRKRVVVIVSLDLDLSMALGFVRLVGALGVLLPSTKPRSRIGLERILIAYPDSHCANDLRLMREQPCWI
ncbi:hypothetical protein Trydic_g18481 [Trypoxylus dichotomus]